MLNFVGGVFALSLSLWSTATNPNATAELLNVPDPIDPPPQTASNNAILRNKLSHPSLLPAPSSFARFLSLIYNLDQTDSMSVLLSVSLSLALYGVASVCIYKYNLGAELYPPYRAQYDV